MLVRPLLLHPDDPQPWGVENPEGVSPIVFVSDHAGRAVPRALGDLGLEEAELGRIRDEIGTTHSPAALGWSLGETPAQDVMLCRAALLEITLPQNWHAEIKRGAQSVFPVTAADLMPEFHGPDLGQRLRSLQKLWLKSDLTMGKAALLQSGDD